MQIDKGSLLLGFVLGLAVAAILISGAIILAPRGRAVDAAAASPTPTHSPRTSTATESTPPTATPTGTAIATATATPSPTTPPRLLYETIEVPPRKFVLQRIPTQAQQTLDLTVQVETDVDLTIYDPTGATAAGPLRVRRSYSLQLRSPAQGDWVLKLDNSFSWLTTKQVLVQYRQLPAP